MTPTERNTWRLVNSGHADAFDNMATDEAILLACAEGRVPPTLRLYGWRPPGVSLGYFQELAGEIDSEECRRRGFSVVRRPTGGRAILHNDEVTYSLCVREDDITGGHGVMSSYRTISRGIEAAFARLGLPAQLGDSAGVPATRGKGARLLPAACFAKSSRADLIHAGRKIVGSAQTRKHGAILQHGSIPLSLNLDDVLAVMPGRGDLGDGGCLERQLHTVAVSVSEAVGRRVDYDEMCQALVRGFQEAFGIELALGELTTAESRTARELR
ncbi:MAG: biotin/lipoate A/B protein ligase family protein, partial [Armatimonadota bacterium]